MKFNKVILDNGMTIAMMPYSKIDKIGIGFFVGVGARNEESDENGISHFLEHMMFKGTENRTGLEIDNDLDSIGAIYNAVTSMSYTYYYFISHEKHLKKLADIVLDIYSNNKINKKDFEKERMVVIEEMYMRQDNPEYKLSRMSCNKFFKNSSYSRPVIGSEENLRSFTKSDLVKYRKKFYRPDNTIFVVYGNFEKNYVSKLFTSHLKNLTNPDNIILTRNYDINTILGNMHSQEKPYIHFYKNIYLSPVYVEIDFPTFDLYNKHYLELDAITYILSTGFSSRLTHALRVSKGITYNNSSEIVSYGGISYLSISFTTRPETCQEAINIVLKELKRLKKKEISNEEIKRIKNDFNAPPDPINFGKVHQNMVNAGINLLFNRSYVPELNTKKIKPKPVKISADNIKKLSNIIFKKDKLNVFVYGNVTSTDIKLFNF